MQWSHRLSFLISFLTFVSSEPFSLPSLSKKHLGVPSSKSSKSSSTCSTLHCVPTSFMKSNRPLLEEPPSIQSLIHEAHSLYQTTYETIETTSSSSDDVICAVAPGRVNVIGEHTDYTGGFVFPMAIGYSTVCIGTGTITTFNKKNDDGTTTATTTSSNGSDDSRKCSIISGQQSNKKEAISLQVTSDMEPLERGHEHEWTNYVMGVIIEYLKELEEINGDEGEGTCTRICISLQLAFVGNVPLGSGLSSSAALEVATATFLEQLIANQLPKKLYQSKLTIGNKKKKAIKCQAAENKFCNSPCGIMDQFVSSAALPGHLILIDCRSLNYEAVKMGEHTTTTDDITDTATADGASSSTGTEKPVFVICNSNVQHSIGGGEYPVRVRQCQEATTALQSIHDDDDNDNRIQLLRDATIQDVEQLQIRASDESSDSVEKVIYQRAKHVVTENGRTQLAKKALESGNWVQLGTLMNQSHESMKYDYQVSCEEIDVLVQIAQGFEGVYGSRLTGGGFGGCTVTLVKKDKVASFMEYIQSEYLKQTGKVCDCFETSPGDGARIVDL